MLLAERKLNTNSISGCVYSIGSRRTTPLPSTQSALKNARKRALSRSPFDFGIGFDIESLTRSSGCSLLLASLNTPVLGTPVLGGPATPRSASNNGGSYGHLGAGIQNVLCL